MPESRKKRPTPTDGGRTAAISAPVLHLKTRGRAGALPRRSLKRWAGLLWVAGIRTNVTRLDGLFESGAQKISNERLH